MEYYFSKTIAGSFDDAIQKVTATIPVGKGPNSISYWFEVGGMP